MFCVLTSRKRTGSNLFCGKSKYYVRGEDFRRISLQTYLGILHNHPEIIMHNELFNQIDIFSYHPKALERKEGDSESKWNFLSRDLWPEVFLEHIWSGQYSNGGKIKESGKAVGFKSFPDHWKDSSNDDVFKDLMDDFRIKKIVLKREDELAVYVSMMRAEKTGIYMSNKYPEDLRVRVDPVKFQTFLNNYRR